MRGVTLATLRTKLKAELRDAQETNTVIDTEYNYALSNKQTDLTNGFDWPFLLEKWDVFLSRGDRYVNFPTTTTRGPTYTMNLARPFKVDRRFNTTVTTQFWLPMEYGIGSKEYNARNSDMGVVADPLQRWQWDTNDSEATTPAQFEVWPMPASAQVIRFTGQRVPQTLASDSDKAEIDDQLLVYMVAADYLAFREQKNAAVVAKKASDLLMQLRGGYPEDSEPLVLGRQRRIERRDVKIIAVAS